MSFLKNSQFSKMPNEQNKKQLAAKRKAKGFESQLNEFQGSKHKHTTGKHDAANMVLKEDTYRLNKVIAASGLYSRRQADTLISTGKVQVNGKVITELGYKLSNPNQCAITVHGERIRTQHRVRTIAFNKPTDLITTRSDEKNRRTIFDVLPQELHGLDPAGRLDRKTSGLLILTNDGELLHELTHPKYHLPKIYRVRLNKVVDNAEALAEKLLNGIYFEEEKQMAVADEVYQLDYDEFGISIHTGMNRQVRRMFEACGFDVTTLKRIAIGPYVMQGLRPGEFKELRYNEVMMLKKALKKAGNQARHTTDTQAAFKINSESESGLGSQPKPQKKTFKAEYVIPDAPDAAPKGKKETVEETVKRLRATMPESFESMAELEAWLSH
ncbi:MAG: pseudouridine synthase [Vampirovibrionales bacterium]